MIYDLQHTKVKSVTCEQRQRVPHGSISGGCDAEGGSDRAMCSVDVVGAEGGSGFFL